VFMDAVRQSLASAIDGLFIVAMFIALVGLVVVLFLREDRLRKTHLTVEQQEMMMAEAEAGAAGGFSPEGSSTEDGSEPVISYGRDDEAEFEPAG